MVQEGALTALASVADCAQVSLLPLNRSVCDAACFYGPDSASFVQADKGEYRLRTD